MICIEDIVIKLGVKICDSIHLMKKTKIALKQYWVSHGGVNRALALQSKDQWFNPWHRQLGKVVNQDKSSWTHTKLSSSTTLFYLFILPIYFIFFILLLLESFI